MSLQQLIDKIHYVSPQIEIICVNGNGLPVLYCSQNVERILGLEPKQLVDERQHFQDLIHPDDLALVVAEIDRACKLSTTELIHRDYRVKNSAGGYHWVEDHTHLERSPSGEVEYLISCLSIVDKRHQTESKLTESRDRLELVLQGTRLGMWDWYPQTNDVVFDERWASMLGVKLNDLEMVLEDWSSRVHPDDIDGCFADIQAHIDGKVDFYENLHRMKHANGEWRYILDRGRIVERDRDGKPLRFTGTHTDVTPLKLAELRAIDALSARERFFSSMSHELRTPMHAVLGLVDLLLKDPRADQITKELQTIQQSGEHLLGLLKDILDVAKLESGELSINIEPVNLAVELENLSRLFHARAVDAKLKFLTQITKDELWISADRQRIVQVLTNLLSNAIKYTPSGGSVQLMLHSKKIEVMDTGVGIKNIQQAFQPFSQELEQEDEHSTGLGLSIVKQLTSLMGIKLKVESEYGQGSRFVLDFGNILSEAPSIETIIRRESVLAELKPGKLLLVDDNPTNLMVAQAMLATSPLEIFKASDGEQAIAIYQETKPDIILMDLHMPVMGGLQATEVIRKTDKAVQIIGLSADAFEQAKADALESGMNDYLVKPFTQPELLAVLAKAQATLADDSC